MSAVQEFRPARPTRSAGNAAPPAGGPSNATRRGAPGCMPEAASALADLRLAQMRALRHRFRNDLQSVCSLASFHGRRADGLASEAGFASIGRHAMALGALYEEMLRGDGEDAVNFASYLASLCARMAAADSPAGTRFALHDATAVRSAAAPAAIMDHPAASALGTVVAELAAAMAGTGSAGASRAGAGPQVLVQLLPGDGTGRGRVTVSIAAQGWRRLADAAESGCPGRRRAGPLRVRHGGRLVHTLLINQLRSAAKWA